MRIVESYINDLGVNCTRVVNTTNKFLYNEKGVKLTKDEINKKVNQIKQDFNNQSLNEYKHNIKSYGI